MIAIVTLAELRRELESFGFTRPPTGFRAHKVTITYADGVYRAALTDHNAWIHGSTGTTLEDAINGMVRTMHNAKAARSEVK